VSDGLALYRVQAAGSGLLHAAVPPVSREIVSPIRKSPLERNKVSPRS